MKKRRTREGKQSNTLQDLGLGQDVPGDDFSDQPDCGSRIGGVRGVDEYGIEGGVADEWSGEKKSTGAHQEEAKLVENVQAGLESIEEFSVEGEAESDQIAEEIAEKVEDEMVGETIPGDLKDLIEYRLSHHDRIDAGNVSVRVDPPGFVVIKGRVRSESESLRVTEVISALPGVYAIRNQLIVPR